MGERRKRRNNAKLDTKIKITLMDKTETVSDKIQLAYAQYWDMVKDVVDIEGWVYTKEVPHMLDAYFEGNTGKPIEFQKSFGNPYYETRGSRWRPKELKLSTPTTHEDELESAIWMANNLLDEPNADPDDDIRTISRQFLRLVEQNQSLRSELQKAKELNRELVKGLKAVLSDVNEYGSVYSGTISESTLELLESLIKKSSE